MKVWTTGSESMDKRKWKHGQQEVKVWKTGSEENWVYNKNKYLQIIISKLLQYTA